MKGRRDNRTATNLFTEAELYDLDRSRPRTPRPKRSEIGPIYVNSPRFRPKRTLRWFVELVATGLVIAVVAGVLGWAFANGCGG